jgi:hypothetical protein
MTLKVISSHFIVTMQSKVPNVIKLLYKSSPTIVEPARVEKMHDLANIRQLEHAYDEFILANQHSLTLYELIDYVLDIRDAITIRRYQLERYYASINII